MAKMKDKPIIQSGECRICGCTEANACSDEDGVPCGWADLTRTLCDARYCVERDKVDGMAEYEIHAHFAGFEPSVKRQVLARMYAAFTDA